MICRMIHTKNITVHCSIYKELIAQWCSFNSVDAVRLALWTYSSPWNLPAFIVCTNVSGNKYVFDSDTNTPWISPAKTTELTWTSYWSMPFIQTSSAKRSGKQWFFFHFRPIFHHPHSRLLTTDKSNWPKVSVVYLNCLFFTLLSCL